MRNLILTTLIIFSSLLSYAQKDVTKFLGIPVDGTKSAMIAKLKAKGFTRRSIKQDYLEGHFNGSKVQIYIVTNKNKVWRIAVSRDIGNDETQVKAHFNNLCDQFDNNSKYTPLYNARIPDEDRLFYQIGVLNKQYAASYIQRDKNGNYDGDNNRLVWITLLNNYGNYFLTIYYDNIYNQANGEDL